MKLTVLGDGAWGTALASVLADNGHEVFIWCHNADVATAIMHDHMNHLYMPGIVLDQRIQATTNMQHAVAHADSIIEAIPVKYLRSIILTTVPWYAGQSWIILSKGIEQKTLLLPSQIIDDVFGQEIAKVIVSGPSFAHDLIHKQLTAVALAGTASSLLHEMQGMLSNSYFHLQPCDDIVGIQIGGALKNVIALALGMLDGSGYTDNTKAFFLTQGLAEIAALTESMGGKKETIYGLAGVGDLVLTATGKHSKNLALGKKYGAGNVPSALLPEGFNTLQSVNALADKYQVSMPLCQGLYGVIFENESFDSFCSDLFALVLK